MIISASIVKKPRKIRRCDICGALINGSQMRIYKESKYNNPPYMVYIHPECNHSQEAKLKVEKTKINSN